MPRTRLHPTRAFWLIGLTTSAVLFASAAPSPIYPIYQQLWGFSAFTLTVIFAVYVVALLASLLTVGSISDHVGRRPVIAVSLIALIASMIVFLAADGVALLIVARALQGLATGAILGTLSATMIDLQPSERAGSVTSSAAPALGLAGGVAVAGFLVQYAPAPRLLVYVLTAVLFLVLLVALAVVPESSARHGFESRAHLWQTLRPQPSLPSAVRPVFFAAVPALLATWSLGGLYLSLGSSIVARLFGIDNHALAGAMLFCFFGAGALASALAPASTSAKLAIGYSALTLGVLTSLGGMLAESALLYVAGALISGTGFGLAFLGAMGTIAAVTTSADRARVFASVFVVSYLGLSVPAVIAGLAVTEYGLRPTAIGYSLFVALLGASAAAAALSVAARARRTPQIEPEPAVACPVG